VLYSNDYEVFAHPFYLSSTRSCAAMKVRSRQSRVTSQSSLERVTIADSSVTITKEASWESGLVMGKAPCPFPYPGLYMAQLLFYQPHCFRPSSLLVSPQSIHCIQSCLTPKMRILHSPRGDPQKQFTGSHGGRETFQMAGTPAIRPRLKTPITNRRPLHKLTPECLPNIRLVE
jgi:hypothetical protein